VRDQQPNTDVILMTAFGTIQEAVSAVRETAIEYLTKPSRYPRFWPWSGASTSTGAS
jgi:DNA-binding NtrC family response regulator